MTHGPRCIVIALSALFSVQLATQAHGAFVRTGELTVESNQYDGFPEDGESYTDAFIRVDNPGNLVVDFGPLDATSLQITWTAPAGKLIEVAPPVGYESASLSFNFGTGSLSAAGSVNLGGSVQLSGAEGDALPAASIASFSLTGPGGNRFSAGVLFGPLTPGNVSRFASLTITSQSPVPASYSQSFDGPLRFEIEGQAENESQVLPNPGQWIRIVDIPEPTSLALLGLGGIALLRRRP